MRDKVTSVEQRACAVRVSSDVLLLLLLRWLSLAALLRSSEMMLPVDDDK
jgi:hypothetical protein